MYRLREYARKICHRVGLPIRALSAARADCGESFDPTVEQPPSGAAGLPAQTSELTACHASATAEWHAASASQSFLSTTFKFTAFCASAPGCRYVHLRSTTVALMNLQIDSR